MMPWWFWILVGLLPAIAVGFPAWIHWMKRRRSE